MNPPGKHLPRGHLSGKEPECEQKYGRPKPPVGSYAPTSWPGLTRPSRCRACHRRASCPWVAVRRGEAALRAEGGHEVGATVFENKSPERVSAPGQTFRSSLQIALPVRRV